ncbi:GNAT family N-acetyltransferase [Thorsellia anophelis]|uniref:Acetyltransferase (GNAT) domain-containing protein n=1 Tax=Thorsellia anophelis DSM 18579 TaxID=1123402 RepID=A0A1I0AT02_9GAMM|nr:GNAT family N-acetyltransferase [Thorsellia anophelis]SES97473.1 Acetyltransferase (GNAT) domain-containing protein [Thorsellia anophelis DSM 18579]
MNTMNSHHTQNAKTSFSHELSFKCLTTRKEFFQYKVVDFLIPVSHLYPNFHAWLYFTFVRQMNNDSRKVLVVLDGNNVIAATLLKITEEEEKICTFFVDQNFRGQGIGTELMEKSLELFSDKVHISVCSQRLNELNDFLVQKHLFCLDRDVSGYYRPDSVEYFFSKKV